MEILVQGVKPEEWFYEGTCSRCKTKVRFQEKEAKKVDDQREGSYVYVPCPTCGSTIYGTFISRNAPTSKSSSYDCSYPYDR